AQRLLRTLCRHCKRERELDGQAIRHYGLARFLKEGQRSVYQAEGCEHCLDTGYAGRIAIHELFVLDEDMHRVIMSGADATVLHAAARRQGMITLYEDGLRKVVAGSTSLEEVMRVTQDQTESADQVEAAAALASPAV
ncbi:MAG: type II secretion system protein GspE, partial [Parahaliea sp.]